MMVYHSLLINYNTLQNFKFVVIKKKVFFLITTNLNTFYYRFFLQKPFFVKLNTQGIFFKKFFFDFFNLKILTTFFYLIKKFNFPIIKRLFLRGLGLRVNYDNENSILKLKLGYSHLFSIHINKLYYSIVLYKKRIIIKGFNFVNIGNLAYKLKKLKMPNSYKGKGIWYKREKKKLKPVKK